MGITPLWRLASRVVDYIVPLSFGAPGYWVRRRTWDRPDFPKSLDLSEKTIVVTGANSGLGYATTQSLASQGAHVIMVCRSEERAVKARREIETAIQDAEKPGKLSLELCDMSNLNSVRKLVESLTESTPKVDVLVNNAGALFAEKQTSVDGYDLSFATNVLGPFLLTMKLKPQLAAAKGARVIWVSSGGMYPVKLNVDDLNFDKKAFDGVEAYAQNKRAQIILTEMMADSFKQSAIQVHAMHPGWADTPGVQGSLPTFRKLTRLFLRDNDQGADTIVWLAAVEEIPAKPGTFWLDREPRRKHIPFANTRSSNEDRQKLWQTCLQATGLETLSDPQLTNLPNPAR